ncbi:substrate-binding domain-containing protein [Photobacterium kishitanii]|uniref:substrate-binding domain-containing protein n=1 Tax=Photobacterium kishitanii TaxID=318456 RepID=UPI0027396CBE|nr:substrate-binding domain-containing protein [Photobacterium kishitanii]
MKPFSRKFSTVVLASLAFVSTNVCAAPSGANMSIWIDVGGPVGGPYATVVQNGAKQAAEDLGANLRVVYSDWQPQKMIENFKQAVAASPSGIIIMGHPGDSAYQPLVTEAETKGINVTSIDTALPASMNAMQNKGFGYVGVSNAKRGIKLAARSITSRSI